MPETPTTAASEAPAATPPPPAIEVRDLRKAFGEQPAVDGLSFTVPTGEIFGFIGPNGAGKTTTLRILATLLEPSGGEVRVDGRSLEEDTEEIRRIVGYLPESFGVYETMTVGEYLDFFARAYRLPSPRREAVVRDVLDLTDLGSVRDRIVAGLSRGMKQRLCLAKTLVHDPKILLLDEPASALDARARIELRALLKELGRMGKTIVVSSHILTELSDLCTSVAIIERGRLVRTADMRRPGGLGGVKVRMRLHAPRPDVRDLLGSHPDVRGLRADETEIAFEYLGAPPDFHRVLKILVDNGVPVLSVVEEDRDLEGLFLQVTRGDVQ